MLFISGVTMMAIRITKEPDEEERENDLARIGKMLIPFFVFFVLALMLGEAWEGWDFNTRAAVVLAIMMIATILYRNELSDILYK